ncbi:NAD-dependent epimerase/dehydratase family protein [Thermodesulforhabdus norvegica]|uniref:Nucleoside-diphosphate-sugar epimerase n=1 Tax=Thermodesulforhabdus norvegica TaxID=39841 RepID=A0A1I4W4F0_9BACT|nr:NAD-dependent epimerase/dehydratase family protein [Thermodesulforhabdus norvegica]SFN07919.1 Nucleoside-diphosphate-sugar epimerase [Thermodesulforhabdus norvegica]
MADLITGGTGFLGSALARLLIEEGKRPVLFDIAPPRGVLLRYRDGYSYVRGSLSNLSEILNCFRKFRINRVFHLGGLLSLPSENSPWEAFQANVVGTYNVLEACRLEDTGMVIYGSSIATFSEGLSSPIVDDFAPQRPTSMYGVTKVFGELLGRYYSRRFGLDFRGVRLPSVVGPGARTAHMSIYNSWAIEKPLMNEPYVIPCNPDTRCPVLYFKDAARALLMLARADGLALKTRIYNIGGIAPPFSAEELVAVVKSKIPNAQLSFRPDPEITFLLKELGRITFDDSAARVEWGWEPRYDLEQMVDDFIDEFRRFRDVYEQG